MPLLTVDHLLKFIFETVTDLAFVPALSVVSSRGRHLEFFLGLLQLFTSFFYNLCNALDTELFLTELKWHQITNVTSITYSKYVCMCSSLRPAFLTLSSNVPYC